MKRYTDCPQILRDFLTYHETIKGQSQRTISEYYLDLRMFLRFIKLMRNDMPIHTRLEDIDIRDVDIEFIRPITSSDIFDFLSYLANDRVQSCSKPHLILVLHRVNRASLCLLLYPNIYIIFQIEEITCFYCNKFFFHLFALIYLCGVYGRAILVSRSLHRHTDGIHISLRNDFAIQNQTVPLQIYPNFCSRFGTNDTDSFECLQLAALYAWIGNSHHDLCVYSRDFLCCNMYVFF